MKIAVRRTGTYRHSGFAFVDSVRVPQITCPKPGSLRNAFTPDGLSWSCSPSPTLRASAATPRSDVSTPAGAFQTPRRPSIFAHIPAANDDGGMEMVGD